MGSSMFSKFALRLLTGSVFIVLVACGTKTERKTVPAEIDTTTPTSSKPIEVEQQLQQQDQEAVAKAEPAKPLLLPEQEKNFEAEVSSAPVQESEKKIANKEAVKPVEDNSINREERTSIEFSPLKNKDKTLEFCNASKKDHKKKFVCELLPAAIRMNKIVYKQRLQVLALEQKSKKTSLDSEERRWLAEIKKQFILKESASFADLLSRVDIVPLSILITQAAIESGWGTSRASLQAKNIFGIHGNIKSDNCMPALKDPSVCIKKYASIDQSLSDYIQFLNTKKSTEGFRQKRAQMRAQDVVLDPFALVATLTRYSERGTEYTRQVSAMMKGQNFVQFVFQEDLDKDV